MKTASIKKINAKPQEIEIVLRDGTHKLGQRWQVTTRMGNRATMDLAQDDPQIEEITEAIAAGKIDFS